MNAKKIWQVGAVLAAIIAVAGVFALHVWMEKRGRERAMADTVRPKGLLHDPVADGGRSFVAIPPFLSHSAAAAEIGSQVFHDKRFVRSPRQTCAFCHLLNEGGTDGKVRDGVRTGPVVNAVLATCYLHDGSVTGLANVVWKMFEEESYAGCRSLEKRVARLRKEDAELVARFKGVYGDGLTSTNVVDSVVQYAHTQMLLSQGRAFDLYCGGRTNALDETQKEGVVAFQTGRCLACHDGAALGGRRIHNGLKVAGLRGIPQRKVYFADGSCTNLVEAVNRMCPRELDVAARRSLLAFLKAL